MLPNNLKEILDKKSNDALSYYTITEAEGEEDLIIGSPDDTVLDPTYDKEYFLKSFDVGENRVVIKTIGIGRNKPVSIYINDARWELFPGPIYGEKEVKKFIGSKQFEGWVERTFKKQTNEEGGAGEEGTDELTKKYKEDTPGEDPEKDEVKESILNALTYSCEENIPTTIIFENENPVEINPETSKNLLRIRRSLNTKNTVSYDQLISESKESFLKLVNFADKNAMGDTNV